MRWKTINKRKKRRYQPERKIGLGKLQIRIRCDTTGWNASIDKLRRQFETI